MESPDDANSYHDASQTCLIRSPSTGAMTFSVRFSRLPSKTGRLVNRVRAFALFFRKFFIFIIFYLKSNPDFRFLCESSAKKLESFPGSDIALHRPVPLVRFHYFKQSSIHRFAKGAVVRHAHTHVVGVEGFGQDVNATGELAFHHVP